MRACVRPMLARGISLLLLQLLSAVGPEPQPTIAQPVVACVDWCAEPVARTGAVHSLHDVSSGASGNPLHDDVYPPSVYDIVDEINERRRELGHPLDRIWWANGVEWQWPLNHTVNSLTRVLHADPEPTPPNYTSQRAHWDLRALDVKVLNLQASVKFPETSILQLQGPRADLLADSSGKKLGEYFSRVLDWYQHGGFTDEFGQYHHSGHNITFGYLEILNEIDGSFDADLCKHQGICNSPLNATRAYIKLYDGVVSVVRQRHPKMKFVGNCLSQRGEEDGGIVWRTFLNRSEHATGTPWPIDAVSYHLYTTSSWEPALPFNQWPALLVENARETLISARVVSPLIKQLSPTTQIFVDEMGVLFPEPVRAAMNFTTMRGDGGNTSFWNLHSAIYGMWVGELSAVGVDMFGSSQLLGYPAIPANTSDKFRLPVGIPGLESWGVGTPFQPIVTPDGNCPEMTLLDWQTGLGNARWWSLKMLNDGLGWRTKGIAPSCTTSLGVYARGFVGGNSSDGRLPGPTNRAILLANMGNTTASALVQDATDGSSPLWMVADKQAGYDAVPYAQLTVPSGGSVQLPPFALALVFVQDRAGCGNCSTVNVSSTHVAPLSPTSGTNSADLDLSTPADWVEFQQHDGRGPPCTAATAAHCPQYNPPCHCGTPGCTMLCGNPGHNRCCGRNVSSLWSGVPHIQSVATIARPVRGTARLTHIVGFHMEFRYISGSYPPHALIGANFSVQAVSPGADDAGACKVDSPGAGGGPAPLPAALGTLWRSAHYDDYRYCETSPPGVKGPLSCPAFPADLQYYSPTVSVNISLPTPVENWEQPLRLRIVFDNNDRCLLIDLNSLRVGLTWGAL